MANQIYAPIKTLPAEVARKIAAGEVIDRPNAVVRELLDNAVDSGATSINVELVNGGIDKIRISDNGCGMTKEDLANCAKPHATSKIQTEKDLLSLHTLGFRGEALASIAAVSRLEITSKREDNLAYHLEADLLGNHNITPANIDKGTIIQSQALFENFPARRVFLKRPASESLLCKQTFVEKSLAFPQIAFKLHIDNKLRLDLPSTNNYIQRVIQALELKVPEELFYNLKAEDTSPEKNWSFQLIVGDSSINKADKKFINIFVNGRKISEFSLVQAIEYGVEGSFPNGTHPVACLFLEINPTLVDFNIHPAKKEARFKDLSEIHHAVSSTLRKFFLSNNKKHMFENLQPDFLENDFSNSISLMNNLSSKVAYNKPFDNPNNFTSKISDNLSKTDYNDSTNNNYPKDTDYFSSQSKQPITNNFNYTPSGELSRDKATSINSSSINQMITDDFKYIGSAFNVFLLVEKNQQIYVIDQHAGHERVLFEELLETANQKQELIFPYEIEIEDEKQNDYLSSISEQMNEAGFTLTKVDSNKWNITAVPIKWQGNKQSLIDMLFEDRCEPQDFMRHFFATCACKAAVKEGHYLDDLTAINLIKKIFQLKDPHCPHGRPIWFVLSKEELYQRVKRT